MYWKSAFALVLSLILRIPLEAQPPNLAVNGDFDSSINGWTVTGDIAPGDPSSVSLSGVDAFGFEGSGSVRIADPGETTILEQCIEIDPAVRRYTNGVAISGDPVAILRMQFFFDSSCQNPSSGGGGKDLDEFSADFSYLINTHPESNVPSGSTGALLRFGRVGGADVENLFDKSFLIEGLPEDYPQLTSEILFIGGDDLTVDLQGRASGGYVPFEGEYFWDFGDGSTATGQLVNHSFPAPGTYSVNLVYFRGFEQGFASTVDITVPLPRTVDVPALDNFGLALLAAALIGAAVLLLRRRL